MTIRAALASDSDAIWAILERVIRAGETFALPRDMRRDEALSYWFAPTHDVFIALEGNKAAGTHFLRANHSGGGAHVANAGYVTANESSGKGVARSMCVHSLDRARGLGFRVMQFNFVVSTNERALRLWQSFEFEIVGRLPEAFSHPSAGYVDTYVMYRIL
jgi:L-amino acid N-acyltransferase YncA